MADEAAEIEALERELADVESEMAERSYLPLPLPPAKANVGAKASAHMAQPATRLANLFTYLLFILFLFLFREWIRGARQSLTLSLLRARGRVLQNPGREADTA